ncbi:MAG TPA: glycosyltransferase family 4 protein, partial [Abditibacteriaceae bacterium]
VYLIHDLYPDVATALRVLPEEHVVAKRFATLQRSWLHAADKVVVLGRCMGGHLEKRYDLASEKIAVIPNWSDPDKIKPRGKDTKFRASNNLSGIVVLYAGNFGQYQNFDTILDAAKDLQGRREDVTLVFVGEGARKEYIQSRIADEKIGNVRLLPFVPSSEFEDMLASADISLVTLEPGAEGLGVPSKFYNILASGRPTIAIVSPESEVARVLVEENCGVQVTQGDTQELVGALENLAADTTKLAQMGDNARRACEEKYALRHTARQFYEVFQQVANSAK